MNIQIGNRKKRVALLLIAAFAWLFIGSLIIFHQEHVLGKHFRLNSQMFISPKTKDKKDFAFDLHQSIQGLQDFASIAGIFTEQHYEGPVRISIESISAEKAFFQPDACLRPSSALRAPPAA